MLPTDNDKFGCGSTCVPVDAGDQTHSAPYIIHRRRGSDGHLLQQWHSGHGRVLEGIAKIKDGVVALESPIRQKAGMTGTDHNLDATRQRGHGQLFRNGKLADGNLFLRLTAHANG